MAYNEFLAMRLRDALARERSIEEDQMFGGAGFLLHGDILVGVREDSLIVRVGPDGYEDVLLEPHVGEFDVTGRPMKGWVLVGPGGIGHHDELRGWIERATKFGGTLPGE